MIVDQFLKCVCVKIVFLGRKKFLMQKKTNSYMQRVSEGLLCSITIRFNKDFCFVNKFYFHYTALTALFLKVH